MSDPPPYHLEPEGMFLEIPYPLLAAWQRGGYTWRELVAARGLPDAVCARLSDAELHWCYRVVVLWPDVRAYRAETGERGCRPGRAWIGPPRTDDLPCCFLTGVFDAPMTVGARRRWRW